MLGVCINESHKRIAEEIIDQYRPISTTIIADALGRFHTMRGIRHFNKPGNRMIGRALTVRTFSGDNLMVHKAIDVAEPGQVIVVENGGDLGRALLGEIMCKLGQKKGISGYVVDGAIRDSESIRQMGFPVYAKGTNPAGPFKEGPGQINVPISCAGASVQPGDLIIGDDDGIVVVPHDQLIEVLERAKKICQDEENMMQAIEDGTIDRSWIDHLLRNKGFEI